MNNYSLLLNGEPGEPAHVQIDWWVINDAQSADVVDLLQGRKIKHPDKVKVFIDHDTPCGSVEVAVRQKKLIAFACDNGCELFNGAGISHQIMLDQYVKTGQIIAGCFSHGAMYGAMGAYAITLSPEELAQSICEGAIETNIPKKVRIQLDGSLCPPATAKDLALHLCATAGDAMSGSFLVFTGTGDDTLSVADRTTLCQMLNARGVIFGGDSTMECAYTVSLQSIVPVVTGPHNLSHMEKVIGMEDRGINEVFIGGCSGGRIDDLRLAASILEGKHVPPRVRLMIAPATSEIYNQAANEGLLATFLDAGAILMNQGCSVCWGKSQGIVEDGEVLLSAGSRNHKGCAGAETAEVYLCSPAVAAYSALTGKICGGSR